MLKARLVIRNVSIVFLIGLFLGGCATQNATRNPRFYPNAHLTEAGAAEANNDSRYCMSLADEFVQDPENFKKGAQNVGETAVAGAAAGAVSGAILRGAVGRYTAAGAASGAILQLLKELYKSGQQDPTWERFVEQCLANKGYQVYTWG
ncbi:hypothetical protein OAO01_01155 [Oligoflexia bacterium]|nr:hypothetical protein [Oligoflexia bacterium]